MNILTYTETHYHFSTPDPIVTGIFIHKKEDINGFVRYEIKISVKEEDSDFVDWLLITSIDPLVVYSGAWMYNPDKMSFILDYDSAAEFTEKLTLQDIRKMFEDAIVDK